VVGWVGLEGEEGEGRGREKNKNNVLTKGKDI